MLTLTQTLASDSNVNSRAGFGMAESIRVAALARICRIFIFKKCVASVTPEVSGMFATDGPIAVARSIEQKLLRTDAPVARLTVPLGLSGLCSP